MSIAPSRFAIEHNSSGSRRVVCDHSTSEAFEDDWFRTGDLFIRNEKVCYQIVGRFKDMIRRSSENISTLEVEQAQTVGFQSQADKQVHDRFANGCALES